MPISIEAFDLDQLVSKAFGSKEISEQIKGATPRDVSKFKAEIKQQSDHIWKSAGAEVSRFNNLELRLDEEYQSIEMSAPVESQGLKLAALTVGIGIPVVIVALIAGSIYLGAIKGLGVSTTGVAIVIGILLGCLAVFALYTIQNEKFESARARFIKDQRENGQPAVTRSLLNEAKDEITSTLFEHGVLPVTRTIIDRWITPVYGTSISFSVPPSLSASLIPGDEVQTAALIKLQFLLRAMSGGSIGIAGPRGAGKSTLIASVCNDSMRELDGKKVLTVSTSAPVEYQARDFILHLFATLCHRIMECSDEKYDRATWKDWQDIDSAPASTVYRYFPVVARSLYLLGIALIALSLVVASLNVIVHEARLNPGASSVNAAQAPASAASTAIASATPSKNSFDPGARAVSDLFSELGMGAGKLLVCALACILINFLLTLILTSRVQRLEQFRGIARAPGGEGQAQQARSEGGATKRESSARFAALFLIRFLTEIQRLTDTAKELERPRNLAPLLRRAVAWLTEIKFQQSFSSGWAGALKIPGGVEGSVNKARSLAQLQLTLPEIVSGLLDLLERATLEYTVIIGIDELDKLQSDEKAHNFLNEIKAIFGVRGVYYLISVSQNAMSNFERRGLPFRDAFDSSFDDIISVDFMDFDTARRLIVQRVVGMPMQFQALCYCISGGLAREIVRSCRDLAELVSTQPANDLESITHRLVKSDIDAKIQAVTAAVERMSVEPMRSEFLGVLYPLASSTVSADELQAVSDKLTDLMIQPRPRRGQSAPPEPDVKALVSLVEEVSTYFSYLAAIRTFFTNGLKEAPFRDASERGLIEMLASARRAMSVNHSASRARLKVFHDSWQP
ncbi:P-loop NTPase fold protein [Caballeronia humi]|uniref:KAP NTPase domain-containing protein n=1 Tax=Caballeronia humi TaxID=326474 RepID=A0A158GDW3_9BURK|nr:P-loop NTPase fold protein [Caballeronia humi]SAL30226.1 hypothetical protein AWB65_01877 [Caballeronia humi]